jgi:hypothetical protein
MKHQPIISARVRLARLVEQIPDDWLEAIVPPLIVLVARLRRFFAASGDAPGGLEAGVGSGTLALGTGTPIDRVRLQSGRAAGRETDADAAADRAG